MTKHQLAQLLRKLFHIQGPPPPPPPPPPIESWFSAPAAQILATIPGSSLARDSHYWAADADTCVRFIEQCHDESPPYVRITKKKKGFDCDKFAHWFVSFFYRLGWTRVWEVWGDTPGGFHAWNVVDNAEGRFEVEPQHADAWPFGENPKYRIKLWIIPRPG